MKFKYSLLFPSSSITINDRFEASWQILETSRTSLELEYLLSLLDSPANMLYMPSTIGTVALKAGTGSPTWAIYIIKPTYLIKIDFPEKFGPVSTVTGAYEKLFGMNF